MSSAITKGTPTTVSAAVIDCQQEIKCNIAGQDGVTKTVFDVVSSGGVGVVYARDFLKIEGTNQASGSSSDAAITMEGNGQTGYYEFYAGGSNPANNPVGSSGVWQGGFQLYQYPASGGAREVLRIQGETPATGSGILQFVNRSPNGAPYVGVSPAIAPQTGVAVTDGGGIFVLNHPLLTSDSIIMVSGVGVFAALCNITATFFAPGVWKIDSNKSDLSGLLGGVTFNYLIVAF